MLFKGQLYVVVLKHPNLFAKWDTKKEAVRERTSLLSYVFRERVLKFCDSEKLSVTDP